jgi:hypothetical protein
MKSRSLSSCLLAATSVACTDGYPTSDAANVRAARPLTTQAIVATLNELGRSADATARWEYQFVEPCTLTVARDGKARQPVDLRGHWVHTRSGRGATAHTVTLEALNQPQAVELAIFSATEWRDALEATGAIKQLSASCPR